MNNKKIYKKKCDGVVKYFIFLVFCFMMEFLSFNDEYNGNIEFLYLCYMFFVALQISMLTWKSTQKVE